MCQSKGQGGRRCDIGRTLGQKISRKEYLEKIGNEVPEELTNQIKVLKKEHEEYLDHLSKKEQKRQDNLKAKQEREQRRKERVARKEEEAKLKEQKLANKKTPAKIPVQLYLSPKEDADFNEVATTSFLETKKDNGELETFLNKSAQSNKDKEFVEYSEWVKENGEAPEAYLSSYGLTVKQASVLSRERLYEGVREKVEGKITLTEQGNKAISDDTLVLEKAERGIVGRVQSNYNKQGDNSTRSVKRDLMLTEAGNARVERIAKIFNISKGDVLRNQVTGTDHRVRQFHQSIPKYVSRRNTIMEYEKEGGDYRKKGESISEMYERLISDDTITLKD